MSPRSSCAVLADTTRMAARARASSLQFSGCLEFLQKTVQALRENDLQPSPHSAGWYHSYFCPEHGYPLNFDPRSPTEHRCPAGGEHVLVGPRFDGGWRWFVNDRLSRAAYRAALLWVVTDAEPERESVGVGE